MLSDEQISAAPVCDHYWAQVSPAGARGSARLCMSCGQPDARWLNEIDQQLAAAQAAERALVERIEAWAQTVGPDDCSCGGCGLCTWHEVWLPGLRAALASVRPDTEGARPVCAECGEELVWHEGNGGQWLGAHPPREWMNCYGYPTGVKHSPLAARPGTADGGGAA